MSYITSRDIRAQVRESLGSDEDLYDIEGIVDEIIVSFGCVDIDSVPGGEYWGIVAIHYVDQED